MTHKNIDKILESLDGVSPAAAPDFFYTRLKAKMLRQHDEVATKGANNWLLKPAFVFAAFALLIIVNAFVFFNNNSSEKNDIAGNDNIQTIAADYSISDSNSFYDLALEK
jgi:hypothetical protein